MRAYRNQMRSKQTARNRSERNRRLNALGRPQTAFSRLGYLCPPDTRKGSVRRNSEIPKPKACFSDSVSQKTIGETYRFCFHETVVLHFCFHPRSECYALFAYQSCAPLHLCNTVLIQQLLLIYNTVFIQHCCSFATLCSFSNTSDFQKSFIGASDFQYSVNTDFQKMQ
jgi:hypothetical protein